MNRPPYLLVAVVLAVIVVGANANGYFFVVAPNAFRLEHEETVAISIIGSTQQQIVKVWLEYNDDKFSSKNCSLQNGTTLTNITMRVTSDDLKSTTERPQYVTMVATCMGVTKRIDVLMDYNSGYIIVQTDKPIYSPNQTVHYRVLAMTESFKQAKDTPLYVEIIDPKNRTIKRDPVEWLAGNSIYQSKYRIPESADLRRWTIRAFYAGKFKTEARSTFLVDEYVLPTFESTVTIHKKCILRTTQTVEVEVEGRYVYDKPVDGIASLEIFLCSDDIGQLSEPVFLKRMLSQRLSVGKHTFNVDVDEVLRSIHMPPDIGDFPPDGFYLKMRSTLLEAATNNEERGESTIIFAEQPYIFKFDNARKTYKPSFIYKLQVDVLHADGKRVTSGVATVNMAGTNVERKTMNVTDGKVVVQFSTSARTQNQSLEFTVTLNGVSSDPFVVKPSEGDAHVQVEYIIADGISQLRVKGTHGDAAIYSGFIVMILSKGGIVWMKYYDITLEEPINIHGLIESLAPTARALVYLVKTDTGEVVADGIKFTLTPKCRGKLEYELDRSQNYRPSAEAHLDITGEPLMHVGLLAMDKALLLLDDEGILKQNTMYKLMEQHDLGCGPGGEIDNGDIFKRAGLVILSNAQIETPKRESRFCDDKEGKRKKRETKECRAQEVCCSMGYEYGLQIHEENRIYQEHKSDLVVDLPSKCYAKALHLADDLKFKTICIHEYLRVCLETVLSQDDDSIVAKSRTDGMSDYQKDIEKYNDGNEIDTRSNFKESWLFETCQLDINGHYVKELNWPSSITTWSISGVGFSKDYGICIQEPIEAVVYRDFFIQLELPYSAVRMEQILIKATVFNYYSKSIQVRVYLEGQANLCSSALPGAKSSRQTATIEGNSALSFSFPILPLVAGEYEIKVVALAKAEQVNQVDGVMKTLLVVNEGIEVSYTDNICLDPLQQSKVCSNRNRFTESRINDQQSIEVVLNIPTDAIPTTARAYGYISSNLMTNVVDAVLNVPGSIIRLPTGCGEQVMSKLAPLVYAYSYLKQTKQLSDTIESNGHEYVRRGIANMMIHRNDDNSFAIYKGRAGSTWLSAYTVKVFCQANKAMDGIVDVDMYINPTLEFLLDQWVNGAFKEAWRVNRGLVGQLATDESLSAFVLITFLECNYRTNEMNTTVMEIIQRLTNTSLSWYKAKPYHLAITTYALAMTNSTRKWDFLKELQSISQPDGEGEIYWGNKGAQPRASAQSVETTSYALLAFLELNLDTSSGDIVRWLFHQKDGNGAFRSTQDTVVALQALTAYNIRTYAKDVDLEVTIIGSGKPRTFTITHENAEVMQVVPNLIRGYGNTSFTVQVSGTGSALLSIDVTYNKRTTGNPCPFIVSDIETEDITKKPDINQKVRQARNCDVCNKCDEPVNATNHTGEDFTEPPRTRNKRAKTRGLPDGKGKTLSSTKTYCVDFTVSSENQTSMAMVEFGLQTGTEVIENDLKILKDQNARISRYELPRRGLGSILFYIQNINQDPIHFKFRVEDKHGEDTRQMGSVTVYEYYLRERSCTSFYGLDSNFNDPLTYHCQDDTFKDNCVCLQSVCAKDYPRKYRKPNKSKMKRLLGSLYSGICITRKTDYAFIVTVTNRTNDPYNDIEKVTGTIDNILHKGGFISDFTKGDEIAFRWQSFCDYPDMTKDKRYYVIGKGGFTDNTNNKKTIELMASAVVIEKKKKNKFWNVMKNHFEPRIINGCQT